IDDLRMLRRGRRRVHVRQRLRRHRPDRLIRTKPRSSALRRRPVVRIPRIHHVDVVLLHHSVPFSGRVSSLARPRPPIVLPPAPLADSASRAWARSSAASSAPGGNACAAFAGFFATATCCAGAVAGAAFLSRSSITISASWLPAADITPAPTLRIVGASPFQASPAPTAASAVAIVLGAHPSCARNEPASAVPAAPPAVSARRLSGVSSSCLAARGARGAALRNGCFLPFFFFAIVV